MKHETKRTTLMSDQKIDRTTSKTSRAEICEKLTDLIMELASAEMYLRRLSYRDVRSV